MAGAAITLGSNPKKRHKKGIKDPKVDAIVDTKGMVKKSTVATGKDTPKT